MSSRLSDSEGVRVNTFDAGLGYSTLGRVEIVQKGVLSRVKLNTVRTKETTTKVAGRELKPPKAAFLWLRQIDHLEQVLMFLAINILKGDSLAMPVGSERINALG